MNLSLQAFLLLTFISLNAFAKPTMFDLQFIASQQKPGQKCAQLAEDYGQEFTAETKAPVFDTVAQELEGNDFNLCRITIRYAAESRVPVTRIDLSQMENCDIALSYIAQTIPKDFGSPGFCGGVREAWKQVALSRSWIHG